jgi:nucleotide-binding universal stress UspA family protein
MTGKRILVPLDLLRGKTDPLLYLQQMAVESPLCPTLLYVVELNIETPDRRLYRELGADAESALRKLAHRFFGHEEAARVRVRIGRPDEQILAEARFTQPELIIMSSSKPRRWGQFFRSRTVERVVHLAPCPTLVLPGSWNIAPSAGQPAARPRKTPEPSASPMRATWARA